MNLKTAVTYILMTLVVLVGIGFVSQALPQSVRRQVHRVAPFIANVEQNPILRWAPRTHDLSEDTTRPMDLRPGSAPPTYDRFAPDLPDLMTSQRPYPNAHSGRKFHIQTPHTFSEASAFQPKDHSVNRDRFPSHQTAGRIMQLGQTGKLTERRGVPLTPAVTNTSMIETFVDGGSVADEQRRHQLKAVHSIGAFTEQTEQPKNAPFFVKKSQQPHGLNAVRDFLDRQTTPKTAL